VLATIAFHVSMSDSGRCCRKKPCRKPVAGLFTCSWRA
jgi:hypothetical protein